MSTERNALAVRPKWRRAYAPKVRTGCASCKTRHKKCDEAKPSCTSCTNGGWNCVYPVSNAPITISTPEFLQINPPIQVLRDGAREFDFFRTRTALALCTGANDGFWDKVLLRIGSSEETVYHAIVAVSSLHELLVSGDIKNQVAAKHQAALKHYNLAIGNLTGKQESQEVVLICCLLFICVEALMKSPATALKHIHAGAGLLDTWKGKGNSFIETEIRPIFLRLEFAIGSFDRTSVEVYKKKVLTQEKSRKSFNTILEAKESLFRIWNDINGFGYQIMEQNFDAQLIPQSKSFQVKIRDWHAAFNALLDKPEMQNLSRANFRTVNLLRLQYGIAHIWIMTPLSYKYFDTPAPANVFEAHTAEFRTIVQLADIEIAAARDMELAQEAPIFMFEVGIIVPLFLTFLKCHDVVIRGRALDLLRNHTRIEGLWYGPQVEAQLQMLLGLEKQGFDLSDTLEPTVLPRRIKDGKIYTSFW